RDVIWYHYRCPQPPTLFWAVLQKKTLVFAVVPKVLGGLHGTITAQRPENRPELNPLVRNSHHHRLPNRPELSAATRERTSRAPTTPH
ncbi:hypothetical protein, partial [Senegalimassilia anaerobia]